MDRAQNIMKPEQAAILEKMGGVFGEMTEQKQMYLLGKMEGYAEAEMLFKMQEQKKTEENAS